MIPILMSPVLTRIYSPADFGVLAVFMAFTSTVGAIANGRYEAAILLPEKDEEAMNVAAVGAVISVFLGLCFLFLTYLFQKPIAELLDHAQLAHWLYLFPVSSLFISVGSLLNQLNLRDKDYANIMRFHVSRSVGQSVVQLVVGFLKPGEVGLVAGQVFSQAAGNTVLLRKYGSVPLWRSVLSPKEMVRLAKKYANFPKFSIWAVLANTLSFNMISMLISVLYSASTLGFYSIVNRVLGMPMTVIGDAIGQVFQREARDEITSSGRAAAILRATLLRLTLVSLPVFAILYIYSSEMFLIVFGEQWAVAGEYAKLLIPLFFVRFLAVPVMAILNLYEKQRIALLWQIGLLLLVMVSASIAKGTGAGIEQFFIVLTGLLMIHYLLLLVIIYRISLGEPKEGTLKERTCCLVLSGYVNGYSIIRELREQGVKDIILFDTAKSLAAYSNKIKKFVRIKSSNTALQSALESLHQEYEKIVIFPTTEGQIEQLYELRDQISDYCFLPFNQRNIIQSISKITQYTYCQRMGVPYPKSVFVLRQTDLSLVCELPFPIIIKPSQRDTLQDDVFRHMIFRSRHDFEKSEQLLLDYLDRGITFLASEVIPGDSSNIYAYVGYRSRDGEILNEWTGKKLSQYPGRFGVFASASNQAPPEILLQGRKLLEAMDLYGICEPEFKYDPRDGTYKLMEINMRAMMWNRVGNLSGVHIIHTQYLDAIGKKVKKQEQQQKLDIHYVYFKYELMGLFNGTIPFRMFWNNLFHSDKTVFAVFDFLDIKPFLADTFSIVKGIGKRARKTVKRPWRMKHEEHTNFGSPT